MRSEWAKRATLLILFLHLWPFIRLSAQFPEDTLPPDSLAQDTVDYTARFLEAQQQVSVRVPIMPWPGVKGPAPALTRIVFSRDSIEWANAATLGDLLLQVPGVYIWRGGFIGRPEPVNYQGRGATSVEYYLDGLPYLPAGIDSVGVDPSLIGITLLDRVEVERWPGVLRVNLYTRRHDRLAPRSQVGVASGDRDFARYNGAFERRGERGIGLGLAAEYLSSPTASGASSDYSNTQFWAQGSYVPSDRVGLQYQLVRSYPDRRPFVSDLVPEDTIGPGFDAKRTDAQFRLALRSRPGGLGSSLDLTYAHTGWDGAGVNQQINQMGGWLGYRSTTAALGASALYRTRWTSLDLRGNAGWTPTAQITANAEVVYQHHDGGRESRYVSLAAGLQPVPRLSLTGTARLGEQVAAPSVLTDTAQKLRDFGATLGYEHERLGLELGWTRTAAFSPFAYPQFPRIASLAPLPETQWLTLKARIRPLRWIALEGWYSDPREGTPDGIPPTHSYGSVTIRSKFLRQFPSGIFDLKLQVSAETWGSGTIGHDGSGAPIALRGATFVRSFLQLQLQRFMIYWDRGNLTTSGLNYVPGFELPDYGTRFGVQWEFLN